MPLLFCKYREDEMNKEALLDFVRPYYADKDIMHNMWHIELVERKVKQILTAGDYRVDEEGLILAAYFHGFIYNDEYAIVDWLRKHGYVEERIKRIVQIAWESQREEIPVTLEGKILHDAHVLEGGRVYLVVKTLITGSVRGQSLKETMDFMERNVLDRNICYLPETIPLCEEMNRFARSLFEELRSGVC